MRYITKILMVAICLVALSGIVAACDVECKSPGYWKNHPNAWPVNSITIGNSLYTPGEAIEIMEQPVKGDKTYTMFDALVAAKLNVENGCCPPCEIRQLIKEADQWMIDHPLGNEEKRSVEARDDAWQKETTNCYGCIKYHSGEFIYEKLDAFNNGYCH